MIVGGRRVVTVGVTGRRDRSDVVCDGDAPDDGRTSRWSFDCRPSEPLVCSCRTAC